jgi:phospholipid-transporting ATPase
VLILLKIIPIVSNTQGRPTVAYPLIIVIVASAMKDLFEDRKRHQQDRDENERKVLTADAVQRVFKPDEWQNLRVGQVIKVLRD